MKHLITGLLVATALVPAAASAQMRELARDRQDIREERRELNRAYRYGDRDDIRDERDDLRDARREYREDLRDYREDRWDDRRDDRADWRDHRRHNPRAYARGGWRAPFGYSRFGVGSRIAPHYYSPRYAINDPWRYRLPRPYYGTRWVRHYDDVLLIDLRTGRVRQVIRNFYW